MMPALNRLYNRLPVPLQNLAIGLAGWSTMRRRFDGRFRASLREAEDRLAAGEDTITRYRDERIRRYVAHCVKTVPFWQRRFTSLGLDPRDIKGLDDLSLLPILTKAEVKQHRDSFFSTAWPPGRTPRRSTGGTTGASLSFRASPDALREQWAIWWRYWRWHGIPLHERCGYFVGIDVVPAGAGAPYWRHNRPRRQEMFSIFHLRPDTLPGYLDELDRQRLPWLHGYPSVLAIIAAYMLDTGRRLRTPPRWVTTGAENLLPLQVQQIEAAFGVRPRQHYGLAEGVANLSECDHGRLHVDEDFAAVEFSPRAGGATALVGSSLFNPAFCLLRYDTGDLVEPAAEGRCPCGRPGRIVQRIDGRKEDVILLPDGTRLGRLAHIFERLDCLREGQILQRADGGITLRVVPRGQFASTEQAAVMAAARRRLGSEIAVDLVTVERLPRGTNGKLRFVISELQPSTIVETEDER